MAIVYGVEYNAAYIASPPGHNYGYGGAVRYFPFSYTVPAGGLSIGDIVYLAQLPAQSVLDMLLSYVAFAGATATETLGLGWAAYTDQAGAAQAASAAGLLSAILMTTAAAWRGGALITASAIAQSLPVVNQKAFNNRDMVTIYATLGVAAPAAAGTIQGALAVVTP